MPKLICLFHDIISDIEHNEKKRILQEANAEVMGFPGLKASSPNDSFREQRISRNAYRQLVIDLRRSFAQSAPTALTSFLVAPTEMAMPRSLSGEGQEALRRLRKYSDEILNHVSRWALNPENWFLVDTEHSANFFQSRVSSSFPCSVFIDGPLSCSASSSLGVQIERLEEIIRQTGIEQLWSAGNFGEAGHVVILDTGLSEAATNSSNVKQRAVGNLSPTDIDGHGTAVYEIVKAISPRSNVETLCVLQEYSGGEIWNLICALTRFFGERNRIINMSLGIPVEWVNNQDSGGASFTESINNILMSLSANGNICVSSAGNDGVSYLRWPAASQGCLAVGSVNEAFSRSVFSNYLEDGKNYIVALGGDYRKSDGHISSLGSYGMELSRDIYGTSFSSAIASGVLSLLQEYSWFVAMSTKSKISLLRNSCSKNFEGFPVLNVDDIGAIWPL
jgi:hypothetical protein